MKKLIFLTALLAALLTTNIGYAVIGITGVSGTNIADTYDEYGLPILVDDHSGRIDVTAQGNAGPFTFVWNTGATTEDLEGLAKGTYTVTVTNVFGCTKVLSAIVEGCGGGIEEVTYQIIPGTPEHPLDAGINLTVMAQSTPASFYFEWTNKATGAVISTAEDLLHVGPGEYCVYISGSGCSTYRQCITVPRCAYALEGGSFDLIFEPAPQPCFKQSNGGIELTVTGAAAPFQYKWSDGSTTEDISGIAAGVWTVMVTDANGCPRTEMYVLREDIEAVELSDIQHSCNNTQPLGELFITPQPAGVYDYAWSNGVSGQGASHHITHLASGDYCVTVTRPTTGCTFRKCWSIHKQIPPEAIQITSITNTLCGSSISPCTGQISAIINTQLAGEGTYVYQFMGQDYTRTNVSGAVTGLCGGDYTLTVSDAAGCSAAIPFSICCCKGSEAGLSHCYEDYPVGSSPSGLYINNDQVQYPTLENNLQGSIEILNVRYYVGGNLESNIYYNWEKVGDPDFHAGTALISGLTPGTYCVTVTDGCSSTQRCYFVNNYVRKLTVKPSCPGGASGAVTIHFAPESPSPYRIEWSGGIISDVTLPQWSLTDIPAGHYTFTITDSNNFIYTAEATVDEVYNHEGFDHWPVYYPLDFRPFESQDNCWGGTIWGWLNNPQIVAKCQIPYNFTGPVPFSWQITWPDASTATLTLYGEDDCKVTNGPSEYEIPEDGPGGLYAVSIKDDKGCKIDYCFSFGPEIQAPQLTTSNITPLGMPYSVSALTGYFCKKQCGPSCTPSSHTDGSYIDSYSTFKFTPNDPSNPCTSGGQLSMDCPGGGEEILHIPESLVGQEYVDWSHPVSQENGVCTYNVGCLFQFLPTNNIENLQFFGPYTALGYPLYVTTQLQLENDHCNSPSVVDDGGIDHTYFADCPNGVEAQLTDPTTCNGVVFCPNEDGGEVLAWDVLFTEYVKICYYDLAENGQCLFREVCTLSDYIIYEVQVPCTTPIDPDLLCGADQAKPGERSDGGKAELISKHHQRFEVFPNPLDQQYTIIVESDTQGAALLQVTDVAGQLLYEETIALTEGYNAVKLQTDSRIAPGVYFIKMIKPDGTPATKKVVKR